MESQHISSDLLFEIFSRTPLQTLGKCRLLSKECNSLTYESIFMQLHSERTRTVSGFLVQSLRRNKYYSTFVSMEDPHSSKLITLDFLPQPVKIEACSKQGIILSSSQYPHETQYFICKPCTKQWQVLPNPNLKCSTEILGMMVLQLNPLRFKIVRLSKPESKYDQKFDGYSYTLQCEIFDSRDWIWKELDDVNLPFYERLGLKPAISVSNQLHWITSERNVFSFDMERERWELFSLPNPLSKSEYYNSMEMVEHEGKLILICTKQGHEQGDGVEIWIMDKYIKRVWRKSHVVNIEQLESGSCAEAIFYKFKKEHLFGQQVFFFQSDWESFCL